MAKKALTIRTREEMEIAVGSISGLTVDLDLMKCEMDVKIAEIRNQYESRLTAAGQEMEALMNAAEEWARKNPEEFGKKKSIEMTHGVVGYRTGNPTLKTLKGFTWDRVLERLQTHLMVSYIRTKKEVDKESILSEAEKLKDKLPELGLKVFQATSFFVEPKREMDGVRVSTGVA